MTARATRDSCPLGLSRETTSSHAPWVHHGRPGPGHAPGSRLKFHTFVHSRKDNRVGRLDGGVGAGGVYEEPKADRSRSLALLAPLVAALRAHRAAQIEERITAGPEWQDNDLVFAQPNGKAIERKSD